MDVGVFVFVGVGMVLCVFFCGVGVCWLFVGCFSGVYCGLMLVVW